MIKIEALRGFYFLLELARKTCIILRPMKGVIMEMEQNKPIWNKTASEVTVKDQLVVGAVVAAAIVVVPLAIGGVISAGDKLVRKIRVRKFAKEVENTLA